MNRFFVCLPLLVFTALFILFSIQRMTNFFVSCETTRIANSITIQWFTWFSYQFNSNNLFRINRDWVWRWLSSALPVGHLLWLFEHRKQNGLFVAQYNYKLWSKAILEPPLHSVSPRWVKTKNAEQRVIESHISLKIKAVKHLKSTSVRPLRCPLIVTFIALLSLCIQPFIQ